MMKTIFLLLCGFMAFCAVASATPLELSTSTTNIGIGTTSVSNQLGVLNGIAVGSGYVNTTAPANGIIVQGNTGIGTTASTYQLNVAGSTAISGAGDSYFRHNVGVGSTAPNMALDVVGSIRATSFYNVGTNVGVSGTGGTSCACKTFTGGICTVIGACV